MTQGGSIDLVKLLPLKEGQRVVVTTDIMLFKWKIYENLERAIKALPKAFGTHYDAKNSTVIVDANRRFKEEKERRGWVEDEGDDVEPHGQDYLTEVYPVTPQEFKDHFENNQDLLEPPSPRGPPPQFIELAPNFVIHPQTLEFYKTTRLPELLGAPSAVAPVPVPLLSR
jgi:hypothetical protein